MEIADTVFSRARGLMFRKEPVDMLFVFPGDVRFSIWTPFMFFQIDLFFLDRDFRVVESRKKLAPWRFYRPKKKYRHLFESEAGKYSDKEVCSLLNKS
ncbi:MAG: DUF192 domain-containing protein [archaeon]|nr:MAG: DUF192 domain-containing protein [archaeon]